MLSFFSNDASQFCLRALCYLSVCVVPPSSMPLVLDMAQKVAASPSYKAKTSILEFIQVFSFTNFMAMAGDPKVVEAVKDIILNLIQGEKTALQ